MRLVYTPTSPCRREFSSSLDDDFLSVYIIPTYTQVRILLLHLSTYIYTYIAINYHVHL